MPPPPPPEFRDRQLHSAPSAATQAVGRAPAGIVASWDDPRPR